MQAFPRRGGVRGIARTAVAPGTPRYRPKTSRRASSIERSPATSRRPADGPSRCGSTTVVCSTSTRVSCPSRMIDGRKVAARALVEVGEIRTVLKSRNSSAWTTTAYRAPRCSWPRARRGGGSRKTSPLTTVSRQVAVERVPQVARESAASRRDRARRQRAHAPPLAQSNASDDVPPPRAARSARPRSPTSCRHGRCPAPLRRSHRAGHVMSEASQNCSANHSTARRGVASEPDRWAAQNGASESQFRCDHVRVRPVRVMVKMFALANRNLKAEEQADRFIRHRSRLDAAALENGLCPMQRCA